MTAPKEINRLIERFARKKDGDWLKRRAKPGDVPVPEQSDEASETPTGPWHSAIWYHAGDASAAASFEAVYLNASVLREVLESQLGVIQDETEALRDFFQARLRSAILERPTREHDVQDVIEQLLIGRGLQKGSDYDREVGRVKVSAKEVVPDFVLVRLGLAIELKLISRADRVKEAIDEINADITAYSKAYRNLLFVVYDLGFIRDELEFRQDLERTDNVSVIVVKQ